MGLFPIARSRTDSCAEPMKRSFLFDMVLAGIIHESGRFLRKVFGISTTRKRVISFYATRLRVVLISVHE